MHLHVHILLVCYFMCTHWYVLPHAHIIGMSLHVCILSVCRFTRTYYWYVTSHAHIGMSLRVHEQSVCYFMYAYYRYVTSRAYTISISLMCAYYRYVTSFAHTMNVVFKLSPFISHQVRGVILPVVMSHGYMHLGKVCKQFTDVFLQCVL